ncbi:hypothetical protein [Enterococcus pernyi]|nr:hypothetical protein [Enterococcus pernyi]
MPVPVDVEKRKSGQSPNKRREAFKLSLICKKQLLVQLPMPY